MPLTFSACDGHGSVAGLVECASAPGVDAASALMLCAAVQRAGALDRLRVHVLETGPATLAARIDRVRDTGSQTGPRMDFSVSDRGLTAQDYHDFARDLLRFGLPV